MVSYEYEKSILAAETVLSTLIASGNNFADRMDTIEWVPPESNQLDGIYFDMFLSEWN